MEMDPAKVSAVTPWSIPNSRKQLQRFLVFSNFYQRFIRVYCTVAAPLTTLTYSQVWSQAAEGVFQHLKAQFTSAPILLVPDPDRHPPLCSGGGCLSGSGNLKYIRSAKRLNSHQARWSLFFTRFNFSPSYLPGSRNVKPDALSQRFVAGEETAPNPDTILPVWWLFFFFFFFFLFNIFIETI